jgi:hypothetical protein
MGQFFFINKDARAPIFGVAGYYEKRGYPIFYLFFVPNPDKKTLDICLLMVYFPL